VELFDGSISNGVGLHAIPAAGGGSLAPLRRALEADYHEVSALPGGRLPPHGAPDRGADLGGVDAAIGLEPHERVRVIHHRDAPEHAGRPRGLVLSFGPWVDP
jgi:hypothetical protein